MAALQASKSILKGSSTAADSAREKAARDRATALHHAQLIQQRKDAELSIVLHTETLIDVPADAAADPQNPAPADAALVKQLLAPFQPSDYDALIVERNINHRCGYVLCPRACGRGPASAKTQGGWRLIGVGSGRAKDFRVVPREELEKWCSEACARRAMYIKVQLNESPAWERQAMISVKIDLMDEPKPETPHGALADTLQELSINNDARNAADLAFERGDKTTHVRGGLTDIGIKEKTVTLPALPPSLDSGLDEQLSSMHLSLEGYTSTFGNQPGQHKGQLSDMDEDTDWKI